MKISLHKNQFRVCAPGNPIRVTFLRTRNRVQTSGPKNLKSHGSCRLMELYAGSFSKNSGSIWIPVPENPELDTGFYSGECETRLSSSS